MAFGPSKFIVNYTLNGLANGHLIVHTIEWGNLHIQARVTAEGWFEELEFGGSAVLAGPGMEERLGYVVSALCNHNQLKRIYRYPRTWLDSLYKQPYDMIVEMLDRLVALERNPRILLHRQYWLRRMQRLSPDFRRAYLLFKDEFQTYWKFDRDFKARINLSLFLLAREGGGAPRLCLPLLNSDMARLLLTYLVPQL